MIQVDIIILFSCFKVKIVLWSAIFFWTCQDELSWYFHYLVYYLIQWLCNIRVTAIPFFEIGTYAWLFFAYIAINIIEYYATVRGEASYKTGFNPLFSTLKNIRNITIFIISIWCFWSFYFVFWFLRLGFFSFWTKIMLQKIERINDI